MRYPVYNQNIEKTKEVELNPAVFEVEANVGLVHQAAVTQAANSRTVLAHTKGRGEVSGGGKKPWRQKGTGRARHGSSRSPIWVGGGVTFGPTKDRNFAQKINKKMRKKALFICLSDKARENNLIILEDFLATQGKTKKMAEFMNKIVSKLYPKELEISKKIKDAKTKKTTKEIKQIKKINKFNTLIVIDQSDKEVIRSVRNLPGAKIDEAKNLNVLDLLKYKYLIILERALPVIDQTFLK